MVKDYKYNDNLDLKDVDYINVNEMDGRLNDTEYSTHFKQDIYKNASGVQIPIEIYEGWASITSDADFFEEVVPCATFQAAVACAFEVADLAMFIPDS